MCVVLFLLFQESRLQMTTSFELVSGMILGYAQPMRDVVTKLHRLSLSGRKPRISPESYLKIAG